MPIQIWTQDRVPELKMQGTQALVHGMVSAGQSIGRAIEDYQTRKKEKEDELKRVISSDKGFIGAVKAMPDEIRTRLKLPTPLDLSAMQAGEPTALVSGAFKAMGAEQEMANLTDQLEKHAFQQQQRQAQPLFQAAQGQRGQAPLDIPGPLNNEEFARRTAPLDVRSFQQDAARTGYQPTAIDVRLLEAQMENQPKAARGLPLGVERKVTGGTIIGTGDNFEPNYVPDPKAEPEPAPAFDWLIAPDDETFQAGLQTVTDPKMRDRVLKTRSAYQGTKRSPSLQEMMASILTGGIPPAAAKPSAAAKADEKVTSKAQFDALPAGAVYTGKDGKRYRKP